MTDDKTPKGKPSHLRVVTDSGDKLTSKQEHFSQQVATGSTLTDAYRSAYAAEKMKDSSVWVEACKLAQHPKVSQRIDQIIEENAARKQSADDRMKIWVTEQLKHEAMSAQSDSARVAALTQLGRSVGMFTDKVEQNEQGARGASEIEAEIQRKLSALMDG